MMAERNPRGHVNGRRQMSPPTRLPCTVVLGAIGDLVEDVVVHLREAVNVASDTEAVVRRRRGGSAANVVAAACAAGRAARFIGQVGDDPTGEWIVTDLRDLGADVVVRRAGRTGTIIVLVDVAGERTMLSDRGACVDLDDPEPSWLDGLDTLHLPLYSLVGEPLATTTSTLVGWAHERGIRVSVDASSAALIEHVGPITALDRIASLAPTVVLANELEAATLGDDLRPERIGGGLVVVKQGSDPALVLVSGRPAVAVPAVAVDAITDTTGAGDAFAAGFLLALGDGADAVESARAGHRSAAARLESLASLPDA
jgi:sugar/nucleoside kinase (ribokinase family)